MSGKSRGSNASAGGGGAVYGLGLIGALVYYWKEAEGFWEHVWSIGEAILWPAFLVYHLLGFISA
jgi:hypothetical protein